MRATTSGISMLPTDRIAYSPIIERLPLRLPDGARMAIWVIVAVEEWDATQPMPRTVLTPPAGGSPVPDVPNWAWHEYGNRVGFWRFIKVFDEFDIPAAQRICTRSLPPNCTCGSLSKLGIYGSRPDPAQHAKSSGRAA